MPTPPVAVVGAVPIGLAAAAELLGRGEEVVVLEQGERAAAGVRSWGHVRLFSPWSELTSPAAVALLEPTSWVAPVADLLPQA
jgi:2-polyprenyl-6-methoxyphenol hydroxylase-like FAD-dependent oxidoreductase